MGARTGIEWTDSTWNPIGGCRRVSPGCENCYAEKMAWRFKGEGQPFEGLVRDSSSGPRWTGRVIVRRPALAWPLSGAPRYCFVASMSDVFQEGLPEEVSLAIWGVMAVRPSWTFQVLTKRPERARAVLSGASRNDALACALRQMDGPRDRDRLRRAARLDHRRVWPPPNVWLGTSVEDQERAEKRLPHLLEAPAALRFVSAEPLLGSVRLSHWLAPAHEAPAKLGAPHGVRWVVAGGESGPGARPMHPEWARDLRDECRSVGTAFFFKQWGAWAPASLEVDGSRLVDCPNHGRALVQPWRDDQFGRLLDGALWSQRP